MGASSGVWTLEPPVEDASLPPALSWGVEIIESKVVMSDKIGCVRTLRAVTEVVRLGIFSFFRSFLSRENTEAIRFMMEGGREIVVRAGTSGLVGAMR